MQHSKRDCRISLFLLGGDKTPVIKSEFTIEQFEAAFQKYAYQLAVTALQKVPTQPSKEYNHLVIEASGPRIVKAITSNESVDFEKVLSYSKKQPGYNWLMFTIEKKLYSNSPHSTKISFYPDSEKVKEVQAQIQAIIDKLMEGVKPGQRFSLKQLVPQ